MSIVKPHRIGGLIGSIPRTVSGVYGLTKLSEVNFPFAIGGDTYTYIQDGKYWRCHMFSQVGSDTLTFLRGGLVEYLVVGGGGGGGNGQAAVENGGGGGAGGFRAATGFSVSGGKSYAVAVGGGGSSNANGSDSVFSDITSTGGGGGDGTNAASAGGSGGGGGGFSQSSGASGNTPSTSPSQGNAGGNGGTDSGGGGGGASTAGANGNPSSSNGGDGTSSSISGSSVFYAGGGGGAGNAAGLGGVGGGGRGGDNDGGIAAVAGTANTGGGGGGGRGSANEAGGSGGSGIVIVRYQITQAEFEGDEPYYDSVSLLLHMNGSNGSTTFTDSSKHRHAVTANGNAQISTAQSKFGGTSAAFDGTGDYLDGPSDMWSANGEATIEMWLYVASLPLPGSFGAGVFHTAPTADISILPSGAIRVHPADSNFKDTSGTVSLNTWTHLAVVQTATARDVFINGVKQTFSSTTGSPDTVAWTTPAGAIQIAATGAYRVNFNGYIDDLRITKGVARWTGNYTPPQREFRP